jgi:hypothetical protein
MAKVMKRAGTAAAAGAGALIYAGPLRRWMRNWGASAAEIAGALPGDELLDGDVVQSTRAITIHAPPEAIWPWLAQMGDRRGGFYGGEALFRLLGLQHGHSAESVDPRMQALHEGDPIPAGWTAFTARHVEPNRALVLSRGGHGYEYTWAMVLVPAEGGATRLVSRVRYRGSKVLAAASEPIVFAVTRRWFASVKARAERQAHRPPAAPPPESSARGPVA